jgi:hypothetical protein
MVESLLYDQFISLPILAGTVLATSAEQPPAGSRGRAISPVIFEVGSGLL